jgi:hypothetical protein
MSSNPPKRIEAIAPITPPTTTTIMTLNAKVEAAVAPYASLSSHAPTFSIAEIMVMAWVCRKRQDRNYVSDEEVSDWMILTFGAHRKMALEELYKHSLQNCDVSFKSRTPFHNLAFQKTAQIERMGVPLEVHRDNDKGGYSSTPAGARRFLRRTLGYELAEFDLFFKLPVEIRVLIYEEVFRCHADGVQYNDTEFHPKSIVRGLQLSQRGKRPCWDHRDDLTRSSAPHSSRTEHWSMRKKWPSATERTAELMALLFANKQIFEEAMPVFYDVNHFHATSLLELYNMLSHCGARRRPYFTNISFRYSQGTGIKSAARAFELLKDVKRLRHLEIEVVDTDFFGSNRFPMPVHELPGFKVLSSVRVRELYFPLKCPTIESYLKQTMLREARDEALEPPGGKGKSRKGAKTGKNAHAA